MMNYQLSAFSVVLVVSLLIPIANGILVKVSASTTLKQIVSLALATANTLITTAVMSDGTAVLSKETLTVGILGFAIQTATYLGIYKPQNANDRLAPTVGLGKAA